jgi:hypothetical protein
MPYYPAATSIADGDKGDITVSGSGTVFNLDIKPTGAIVGTTDTQTLTNKTLVTPAVDTINESTSTAGVTIDGVLLKDGHITVLGGSSAPITPPTGYGKLAMAGTSNVRPRFVNETGVVETILTNNVETSAALASLTANVSTTSTTAVQIAGASVTFTTVATARRYKVSFYAQDIFCNANAVYRLTLWDGAVGTGTLLQTMLVNNNGSTGLTVPVYLVWIGTPAASTSKTYNIGMHTTAGTVTLEAATTFPAQLLAEPI